MSQLVRCLQLCPDPHHSHDPNHPHVSERNEWNCKQPHVRKNNSEIASYRPELTYNSILKDSPRPPMRGAMLSGEEENGKANEGRS